jgi:nucleotide-binding universal stress UspA family protein
MRILIGVAERGAPELLSDLDRVVRLQSVELLLAHVIDSGVRGEIDLSRGRLLSRPLPAHRLRSIGEAERRAAGTAVEEAAMAASSLGGVPETVIAEGEPGRVLCRLAGERGCDLVAVASRVDRARETPGPHSIGHTSRFVLDHSPRPVLLVRGRWDVATFRRPF